jgi:cellulose synthase/poly-beta-1,6-N-acetylglucosamine synthase-like glycosyltransferase
MIWTRAFFDPALVHLAGMSLAAALLIAWSLPRAYAPRRIPLDDLGQLWLALGGSALVALLVTGEVGGTLLVLGVSLAAVFALYMLLPRLTLAGAIASTTPPLTVIFGAPWSYLLLAEQGFPTWVLAITVVGIVIGFVLLGFSFAGRLAQQSLLTHRRWDRPTQPLAPYAGNQLPKVSIQLPCYSEPPHVVIATIDRLAALDYPHFEVMVCDNNTEDEALWRPLERHCQRLNAALGFERFRFFHVAPLTGAKAGALNFCLDHMARDADLVAVIDADYLSRPDFLSRLVGYFDDPKIGYLQTPHDYRDFTTPYLRNCYWEYMPSNKIDMAGVQEYGAPFTIGTMCLLRTKALHQAGGWAEWCLTEDSEVSVRLRAHGYDGIYLTETFGRGLIPATFDDYKKQRYRWTAGPVQQLRRYWRLFLPTPYGPPSLSGWSKLLEFQRSVVPLTKVATTAAALVTGLLYALLTARGDLPRMVLPTATWAAFLIALPASLVTTWQRYRISGCTRIRDMIGGEIARASLTWVSMVAGIAGLSPRPLGWRRTPKFAIEGSLSRALYATIPELVIGMAHLALLVVLFVMGDQVGGHFSLVASAGILLSSLRFFAAPAMAFLCERDLAAATSKQRASAHHGIEANA